MRDSFSSKATLRIEITKTQEKALRKSCLLTVAYTYLNMNLYRY